MVSAGIYVCVPYVGQQLTEFKKEIIFASWQKAKQIHRLSELSLHEEVTCLKCSYLFCQRNEQVPGFNCEEFTDSSRNTK